jgi:hypothetical protein
MVKRRVFTPERDQGWSNGRYWTPKSKEDNDGDELYDAFCETCDAVAPHQWEDCVMCTVHERERDTKDRVGKDEDLNAFGRDLADV